MVVQAYILVQTNVGKAAEVAGAIGAIQGVTLAEETLRLEDLYSASEVFLTSSTRELLPVASIEGRAVGGHESGQGFGAQERPVAVHDQYEIVGRFKKRKRLLGCMPGALLLLLPNFAKGMAELPELGHHFLPPVPDHDQMARRASLGGSLEDMP